MIEKENYSIKEQVIQHGTTILALNLEVLKISIIDKGKKFASDEFIKTDSALKKKNTDLLFEEEKF